MNSMCLRLAVAIPNPRADRRRRGPQWEREFPEGLYVDIVSRQNENADRTPEDWEEVYFNGGRVVLQEDQVNLIVEHATPRPLDTMGLMCRYNFYPEEASKILDHLLGDGTLSIEDVETAIHRILPIAT